MLLYVFSVAFHYVAMAQDAARAVEMEVCKRACWRGMRNCERYARRSIRFLFNSLNSISALTSIDGARAREMCLLLADFLRLTLEWAKNPLFPFPTSWIAGKIPAIEKVRFGDRCVWRKN